ncbi:molecular chaperone HtpG [Streptomyces tsukubensis]|uniref:molecular chaperone HtpG n=1 Tax=Streptomyces tsukubensis TaxID=83656 RepID=UPI001265E3EC|nr:molecular chaperone HtpG [Streptomyces tsukubensis]QFR94843.1 molecular chaperone HtpG [Streptomyces tsukubensis]
MSAETFEFQVEARQLLQMMIHSIYSNKDVFLRELISNASDALDKLRLEVLRDEGINEDVSDLHIDIEIDKEQRTLTVRDNGIGMSHDEVVKLIGTIANSGTAKFLKELKEAKDSASSEELIGQFGVGFYASFMVADDVTLLTRRAGESGGTRWHSTGEGTYTVESVDDAPQGTSVVLRLKAEDAEDQLFDYASPWKVREIIKRYSDFITWPIRMAVEKPAAQEPEPGAAEGEESAAEDKAEAEVETVNSMKALWARSKSEVTDEEYSELYKHVSHDWNDPLETIRIQAEGAFEYQALLFIPSHAPQDLFMQGFRRGIQLYVKRVSIMDDCEALMPDYLRFVKGVVDAADLSLNVSREILQQDRQIQLMHRRLVKKVLSTVKDMMSRDADRYATFWKEFGAVLKEGLLSDFENREAILGVSSFASTHDAAAPTTLKEYVERMKEGQQHIFYMTGDSRTAMESSPHMEAFKAKGFEVLLLTDRVDEVWVQSVPEFEGKPLQSIAKGEVDLDTEEEKKEVEAEREQRQADFAGLLSWMTDQLGGEVKEVRLSSRLTSSPACIVSDNSDVTPALENMLRAMGQEVPEVKRILELNPTHPLVSGLRKAHAEQAPSGGDAAKDEAADGTADDAADESGTGLAEAAELLHGMALLADGGELSDPSRFIKLMADRVERTL